jgi:hypothetical protein
MRARARWMRVVPIAALAGAAVGPAASGCGARTELRAPALVEAGDAGVDVDDAPEELPRIDQFADAPIPNDCPDAGSTLIYVISSENELLSFYPPTLSFTKIGDIECPNAQSTPYSMAVDRLGTAYSLFSDGTLWQISTANASCEPTSYVPAAQDAPFYNFGMGYAGDQLSESLYVADAKFSANSVGLATLDTDTFTRSFIANFQPELPRCELTGTGDGRLFAFCLFTSGSGSEIAEIDRNTAKVVAVNQLKVGASGDAFAYAFWGGYFWIFTGPGGSTTVTQYDPGTLNESAVTSLGQTIVGAGVSTCAPQ